MKKRKQGKSLPDAAWNYRRKWFPNAPADGHYVALAEIEQAFVAGARWQKRRSVGKSEGT